MIQFKRGSTKSWLNLKKPLADGQPGYDRKRNKIKIGDGASLWAELPDASGLSKNEILCPENDAKDLHRQDSESSTLITYGTEAPDKNTVGQLYLQYYDAEPETDYIVSTGIDGIWTYQKWKSGIARCWGVLPLTASIQTPIDGSGLFCDNKTMKSVSYPFTFDKVPSEVATLQSPGGITWLASRGANTKNKSAVYSLISADNLNNAKYNISIQVDGFWR